MTIAREKTVERVRIGVVGAGYMGRTYAHIVRAHPLAQLVGIADLRLPVAALAATDLDVAPYASAVELLDAGPVDGLIVATVEHEHLEPSRVAFAAGAGVLVEKPIATTVEDAAQIIAAAERAGRPLLVGHVLRFDARYARLQEIVQSGGIGEPLTVYARRLNGIAAQDRLHGRCSLPLFLGVHDYDIVRWVTGSEVTEVVARARKGFLAGIGFAVEDATIALLTLANGVLATVEEGWILPATHPAGFDQRLDVNGSAGRVELEGHEAGLSVMGAERYSWPDTQLWPTVHGEVVGALRRETWHFVDVLRGSAEPLVSGADGLAAIRIALAVEESARTGATVRL
ncbi:MAG: Gfo/Idh/MocA family protein [Thermomicrobiales bacterium]